MPAVIVNNRTRLWVANASIASHNTVCLGPVLGPERRGAEGHHRPLAFNFDLTFDQLRENFSLTLQEVATKYGIAINSKACLRDALPS